jgi:hypothetical protein
MNTLTGLESQPGRLSSLTWIQFGFEIYRSIRQLLRRYFPNGLYELLEYDSTLELVDPKGLSVLFKKRQRVRFLQDNVIAFQDCAWGDGYVLGHYRCSPGVSVDQYKEGDRWNVLISLRETKNRGDIEDFYTERRIKGGFTKREEWWQIEMRYRPAPCKSRSSFRRKDIASERCLLSATETGPRPWAPPHFLNSPMDDRS